MAWFSQRLHLTLVDMRMPTHLPPPATYFGIRALQASPEGTESIDVSESSQLGFVAEQHFFLMPRTSGRMFEMYHIMVVCCLSFVVCCCCSCSCSRSWGLRAASASVISLIDQDLPSALLKLLMHSSALWVNPFSRSEIRPPIISMKYSIDAVQPVQEPRKTSLNLRL